MANFGQVTLQPSADGMRYVEGGLNPSAGGVAYNPHAAGGGGPADSAPHVEFSSTAPAAPASFLSSLENGLTNALTAAQAGIAGSFGQTADPGTFSGRDGVFERAVESCRQELVKDDLDGDIVGAWLLTEIDHWDNEREKVILLTEKSLLMIKFDFITLKVKQPWRRVMLHTIHSIVQGAFTYPPKSLMKHTRDYGGIRVIYGELDKLSWGQKWNPNAGDIPYLTLAHHKLIYNEKERDTATYSVDDFLQSLQQSVESLQLTLSGTTQVTVKKEPILIESYASLSSLIFNQSHLGYYKDRNGVAF